jgi:mannitol-1-phosphate/altronate dehydrogenase
MSEVANMSEHRRTRPAGRRLIPIALAAAGLVAVAGCGGEERLSRDAFSDRLQSIARQGSARYERLAQQATRLKPDQPVTEHVKRGMRQYAGALARAADQLDQLDLPSGAEDETATLTEALRQRADAFERAAREQRVTLRQLEQQRAGTKAGEKIDRAFEQLREHGFLRQDPPTGAHDR